MIVEYKHRSADRLSLVCSTMHKAMIKIRCCPKKATLRTCSTMMADIPYYVFPSLSSLTLIKPAALRGYRLNKRRYRHKCTTATASFS